MSTPPNITRPDWTQWALGLAKAVATRADCSRRQVGAVILDDEHRVLSVGYNGAAPGGLSCLAGQCPRGLSDVAPGSSYDTGAGSCISIHAEANALLFSDPIRRRGGLIDITDEPCDGCLRLLLGSGLARCITPAGEITLR
ncbi:MAG: hypothetical protein WKF57_05895 [Nakamurella sp.]